MALALAAAASLFYPSSSSSSTFIFSRKPSPPLKLRIPLSTLPFSPVIPLTNHLPFHILQFSSAEQVFPVEDKAQEQEEEEEEEEEETHIQEEDEKRRKLCVLNLPWSFSAPHIRDLFSQCGIVKHVEIIKEKGIRHRGFAFITMASGEEARAVIDKFNSYELEGRIIRVEFAKRMNKPSPPPPADAVVGETRHKIYVSNLAWKVRSSHLREFFAASCNPVSAKVVFESPSGRSAGYGFVSFATIEEAEAAVSALDGKELMGRPVSLKISQKKVDESGEKLNEVDISEGQL